MKEANTLIRRWKTRISDATDNPAGMIELEELDSITGWTHALRDEQHLRMLDRRDYLLLHL